MAHHPFVDGGARHERGRGRSGAGGFLYVALIGAAVLFIAGAVSGLVPGRSGSSLLGSLADSVGTLLSDTFGNGRTLVFESGGDRGTGADTRDVREANTVRTEPRCVFASSSDVSPDLVFMNEIAWMGTPGSAQNEWLELMSVATEPADISGWQLVDRDDQIHITFASGTVLPSHGFLLLERKEDSVPGIAADVRYEGSLRNSDEMLGLLDTDCNLVDVVYADPAWPAGENTSKRTMERGTSDRAWYTSAVPGGTPRAPNSEPPARGVRDGATNEAVASSSVRAVTTTGTTTPDAPRTVSDAAEIPLCSQENLGAPTLQVLVSEVAWAGTGSTHTSDEWIELWNVGTSTIRLAGWQLVGGSRTLRVVFDDDDVLTPNGYFLLERTDDDAVPGVPGDKLFTSAIKNNDEALRFFDARCVLVDEVVATTAWPAGTASPDYRSAERSLDLSWHTYGYTAANGIYGTPRRQNSDPVPLPSPSTASTPAENTEADVSSPTIATGTVRVLISEIMVGSDGASSNEFIELFNAGDANVSLTGWSVKKRTSTGSESTLVAASRLEGKTIAPHGYLLLGNDTGYTGATPLDVRWPTSYTLAYSNNAIIVLDATGAAHDEAAWTEVPAGKSYSRVSWEGAAFIVQEVPTPQGSQLP
jgi:hypothetical protein